MRRPSRLAVPSALVALFLAAGPGAAQTWTVVDDPEACDEGRWNADWCEVREAVLPAPDVLMVDGARNGGIRVTGENREDVLVRAHVRVWDTDSGEGKGIAERIEISTDGRIIARGPSRGEGANWSVSYELLVPLRTDLGLEANNGGVSIEGVVGEIEFVTLNGGVHLGGVGGDVRGETRNGGLSIELTGETWQGEGLDVETRNGGVHLVLPEEYSADLETRTVNGKIVTDLPVRRESHRGRHLSAKLGGGGPTVRAVTTNGGVRIRQT